MRMRDHHIRSAIRMTADLARGLAATSVGDGMTALPIGLRLTCCSSKLNRHAWGSCAPARISNKALNDPILKRVKTDHHQSTPLASTDNAALNASCSDSNSLLMCSLMA
ncbi:MAG: hypothetical protein CM15mP74_01290 [Halieaceae bacterium]|nr:MAG: hypothetical protein CM15mP74_01290 [Halieaceae bacterium]